MCAAGPEGGGGAGSAAVAAAGEPAAADVGLTLQATELQRPPSPIPFLSSSGQMSVCLSVFQSWNAHQRLFSNSAFLFHKWGN